MSALTCRELPDTIADGSTNMAADEVLLVSAVSGTRSLRFYGWTEPTVSLGYFQSYRERNEHPRLRSLPYVRRASGGATLVHHHELTYCLALPEAADGREWRCWPGRMHEIIAAALRSLDVSAQLLACVPKQAEARTLCFQSPAVGDVLIAGNKVVGSAQRKQRGALMQHGGILLAASPFAPELPGIGELSGKTIEPGELAARIREEFCRVTHWPLVSCEWSAAELELKHTLRAGKYATAAWNDKR